MNARKKIILSLVAMISIVSLVLLFSIFYSAGRIQSSGDELIAFIDDNVQEHVRPQLLDLARRIGDYVLSVEREIENNMRNAANVLYEADRLAQGRLTHADMLYLRELTGMSDLYIGGVDGVFTLTTDPAGMGLRLFDVWEGYRMLVTGESDYLPSDLKIKVQTGEVFKFVSIPRAEGRGVIESALEAGVVEKYLQNFINAESGIRTMNLFDKTLLTLTQNSAQGVVPHYLKGSFVKAGTTPIDAIFEGTGEVSVSFCEENATIYYPVIDGERTRYVLFIDVNTTGYFEIKQHITSATAQQVEMSSVINRVLLIIILAILLIFTAIIIFFINRIMINYEEQYKNIEQRNKAVLDNENLIKYHTIILLCVGIFFATLQGIQYSMTAVAVIIASVAALAAFITFTRKLLPLDARVHIISNGSFFCAFGCSAVIQSIPDMFGLFLTCAIVGTLYFRKSVIVGMAIVINTTVIVGIYFLRVGIPGEFSNLWFLNNMAGLNCGLILLYAVSLIGKGFIDNITLKSNETELLYVKVKNQNSTIMSGINYASKIQREILPRSDDMAKSFSDYSVIWKPRDVVGGDIYWMKKFDEGTVLCVADCTGHGTSGAFLTMLVVSALEGIVKPKNCRDTADILWRIDDRLANVFGAHTKDRESKAIKDGCDMAVLFIANDKSVTLSSGHFNIFVCNGKETRRFRGQKIFVGEGKLKNKEDVETIVVPADAENKFYIASDGLFDQPGGSPMRPFGYKNFEKIILENHARAQKVISGKVWVEFELHRGAEPRVDDFTLFTFRG